MFKSRRVKIAGVVAFGVAMLGVGTGAAVATLTSNDDAPEPLALPRQDSQPLVKCILPPDAPQGVLPDGRTYGAAPVPAEVPSRGGVADQEQFSALLPDLVLVLGDGGNEGTPMLTSSSVTTRT